MPEGTVTEAVHCHLDSDGAAREMMGRGVLNLRAFARWLIEMHGWEASEDAVLSALRRYDRGPEDGGAQAVREALSQAHVNSRSEVCSFVVARSTSVHRTLADLFEAVQPTQAEPLRFVEGERSIKVVVSSSTLDRVLEAFHDERILEKTHGLAELQVVGPAQPFQRTKGILGHLCTMLAARDVAIVEAMTGVGEVLFLVHEDDMLRSYQALRSICTGERT